MEENKNNTPASGTDDTGKDGGNPSGEPKTFTQEELNNILSERLAKEKAKSEAQLRETIEKERQDAERMAKLSAEEKEKELMAKQKTTLEQKERELTIKENKLQAIQKLSENGLPTNFVDLLVDESIEETLKNIENFQTTFNQAVEKSVAERLKGKSGVDVNLNTKDQQPKPPAKLSF